MLSKLISVSDFLLRSKWNLHSYEPLYAPKSEHEKADELKIDFQLLDISHGKKSDFLLRLIKGKSKNLNWEQKVNKQLIYSKNQ